MTAGVARARRALPDGGPPAALRRVLTVRRRIGLAWSDAMFDKAVSRLTRSLEEHDGQEWRVTLRAQRSMWRAAYERQDDRPILELAVLHRIKD